MQFQFKDNRRIDSYRGKERSTGCDLLDFGCRSVGAAIEDGNIVGKLKIRQIDGFQFQFVGRIVVSGHVQKIVALFGIGRNDQTKIELARWPQQWQCRFQSKGNALGRLGVHIDFLNSGQVVLHGHGKINLAGSTGDIDRQGRTGDKRQNLGRANVATKGRRWDWGGRHSYRFGCGGQLTRGGIVFGGHQGQPSIRIATDQAIAIESALAGAFFVTAAAQGIPAALGLIAGARGAADLEIDVASLGTEIGTQYIASARNVIAILVGSSQQRAKQCRNARGFGGFKNARRCFTARLDGKQTKKVAIRYSTQTTLGRLFVVHGMDLKGIWQESSETSTQSF